MLAYAPSPPRPDALLVPAAPGPAYAADVARLNGREPVGATDDAWLALALAVTRAAAVGVAQRAAVLTAGADGIAALLPDTLPPALRRPLAAAAEGLRTLAAQLARPRGAERPAAQRALDAAAAERALGAVQHAVAQQEQAGAFLLAFSTLAALRTALAPVLGARGEGLLLAQQGRVARQLGALSTAADLYDAAVRAGRAAKAPDVAARALVGVGALATVRGNYPEARSLFRRVLRAADRTDDAELRRAAHHGLLTAALAANDVDTALAHGWAAMRGLSADATDERAEVLVNLGEVGRQAGEHRAALGACLSALEITDVPRVRLPALGTAALAAAKLGEHNLLAFLAREVERAVARSGQPYENARALVELAEACVGTDPAAALEYSGRAITIAEAGKFHEMVVRADNVRADATGRARSAHRERLTATEEQPSIGPVRSVRARAVLRSLESLPGVARYAAAALATT